jgi:hypothetical protein
VLEAAGGDLHRELHRQQHRAGLDRFESRHSDSLIQGVD